MSRIIITGNMVHENIGPSFISYNLDFEVQDIIYTPDLNDIQYEGCGRETHRPYGITSDDTYLYVVSHSKMAKYNLEDLTYAGLLDIPLYLNTHQILYVKDMMITCNTSNDTLGFHYIGNPNNTVETKYFDVSTHQWSEHCKIAGDCNVCDKLHVNSIFYKDNEIYFCCHNLGQKKSDFYVMNLDNRDVTHYKECGYACHGIIVDDDFYTLSSETQELNQLGMPYSRQELYINDWRISITDQGFKLRGLAKHDNKLYIGQDDGNLNASVKIFDLEKRVIVNEIPIEHFDCITDIKII